MAIPVLVGFTFDIVQAWMMGKAEVIRARATPELAAHLDTPEGVREWFDINGPMRTAALAWKEKRVTKARDDGRRGWARFHADADGLWVLVYDTSGPRLMLMGVERMSEAQFEAHGSVV